MPADMDVLAAVPCKAETYGLETVSIHAQAENWYEIAPATAHWTGFAWRRLAVLKNHKAKPIVSPTEKNRAIVLSFFILKA